MKKIYTCFLALSAILSVVACNYDAMDSIIGGPDEDVPLHVKDEDEEDNEKAPGCIRIVQYNVGNFYKSGSSALNMVTDMMKELDADLVSLNEVDSVIARSGNIDQMKAFSSLMGDWNYRYAYAIYHAGGKYGVGACGSPDFNYITGHVIHLPKGAGVEDRAMAVMEFDNFIFASVHLDLNTTEQLNQIDIVNSFFDRRYPDTDKPIFICGDFNNYPMTNTIKKMQETWTLLTPATYTFPAINPTVCIDYIFVRPGAANVRLVKAKVCKVFSSGDVTIASDHLPVYVDVLIQ